MKDANQHFLLRFLDPDGVAIVGASNNPAVSNYFLVANLVNLGFPGKIYPVNPKETEILGLRAYASIQDINGPVDLAVIGVSHIRVPGILRECIQKGIQRVTIIAGGFSEAGENGKKAQNEIRQTVKDHDIRAIGPNALCPINVAAHFCISFNPVSAIPPGGLSLIFQSGLYEPRSSWLLTDFNYHLNKLIDLGNKMDINEVDALAIQLPPMAFLHPQGLLEALGNQVTGRKPIAFWMPGMEPGRNEILQSLEEKGVVVFPSPEQAIRALSALHRFSRRI